MIGETSIHGVLMKMGMQLFLVGSILNFSVLAWKNEEVCLLVEKLEQFYRDVKNWKDSSGYLAIFEKAKNEIGMVTRWYIIVYGLLSYVSYIVYPLIRTFWEHEMDGLEKNHVYTPTSLG